MLRRVPQVTIYPKTHYVMPREKLLSTVDQIKFELKERLAELEKSNKLVEHQRLEQRTNFDMEMILELGFIAQALKIILAICQVEMQGNCRRR